MKTFIGLPDGRATQTRGIWHEIVVKNGILSSNEVSHVEAWNPREGSDVAVGGSE